MSEVIEGARFLHEEVRSALFLREVQGYEKITNYFQNEGVSKHSLEWIEGCIDSTVKLKKDTPHKERPSIHKVKGRISDEVLHLDVLVNNYQGKLQRRDSFHALAAPSFNQVTMYVKPYQPKSSYSLKEKLLNFFSNT